MKVLAPVTVALLQATGLASATLLHRHLLSENASTHQAIQFSSLDMSGMHDNVLLDMVAPAYVACSALPAETVKTGKATVLLAIDKCLRQSDIDSVKAWVSQLNANKKDYFKDNQVTEIEFVTQLIPGDCSAVSGTPSLHTDVEEDMLLSDGTDYRASRDVLPGEVERIAAFAELGRVLDGPEGREGDKPDVDNVNVGVISVVNNGYSLDYIDNYVRTLDLPFSLTFDVCSGGRCRRLQACDAYMECETIESVGEMFFYNPYRIKRRLQCNNLEGGVPVSFVDNSDSRQCFCACPVGWRMTLVGGRKKCVAADAGTHQCSWKDQRYKIQNQANLRTCAFTGVTASGGVAVPFPSDNYVADVRTNSEDPSPTTGPRVNLEKKGNTLDNPAAGVASATNYPWAVYQGDPAQKVNSLEFNSYGTYDLKLTAFDYFSSAECKGCLAIVDKFRPQAVDTCPASCKDLNVYQVNGVDTKEMTLDNVNEADGLVDNFYKYQRTATNDACTVQNRCDAETHDVRDFFSINFIAGTYANGDQCFDKDKVFLALVQNPTARSNPLVDGSGNCKQDEAPVTENMCTRCCRYGVALKEYWTDYTCGATATSTCSGDPTQTCNFAQCLTVTGETMVSTCVTIAKAVREESKKVLEAIDLPGTQYETQIHRALSCTKYGDATDGCKFTSTVEALLEPDQTLLLPYTNGAKGKDYVFWRYKVGSGPWRVFGTNTAHTFTVADTTIQLQAWTQCGLVKNYYFSVMLHLHNEVKVCDVISTMWYQTLEVALTKPKNADFCTFPGSDFAELTFDYHPDVGLQFAREKLQMSIYQVQCSFKYKDRAGAAVTIVDKKSGSMEIVERFAVELLNKARTQAVTNVLTSCQFTYKHYDGSKTDPIGCDKEFTISDCNGPAIDLSQAKGQYDTCKLPANADKAGPFEACGGDIVYATATETKRTNSRSCCTGTAAAPTQCVSIFAPDYPDASESIRRCVPQFADPKDLDKWEYLTYARALAATAAAHAQSAPALTAALSATALVAVVALVAAVRRRRSGADKAVEEDAYYPLLH